MKPKAHVAQWKKDRVKDVAKYCEEYPIIGIVNMENLPAAQLQVMQKKLRGTMTLVMTRRTLLNRAIDSLKDKKPGLEKIKEHYATGMPALLFTKENPFSLFKTLKKSKSKAPAKAGQLAPYDLVIPAGPTQFPAGPIISDFAAIGVQAGVEAGKVAVKKEAVVAREGEAIKPAVANMLTRMGIEPMEIGLNLVAVFEDGTIYDRKVLDIDEEQFMADLTQAIQYGLNLAVESVFFTTETTELLVQKGARHARGLALEGNILAKDVVGDVLAKAQRVAQSLKEQTNQG